VILRILFKAVAAFLAIGQENKKFYEFLGVPEKKIFFVPYAVDNDWFIKKHRELRIRNYELRKELGIDPKAVVILFVGKFTPKKRPLDLLRAYELLTNDQRPTTNDKAALVLVGDGELRPALEHYVKSRKLPNVYFAGFQNQSQLPKYYALSDIFVLPSGLGETWGVVINEAMCFGLAVIVSDIVGCGPDLVKQAKNGYIYPLGDIARLANYLGELIENPDKTKAFGQKSFEIIQGYSYKSGVQGIINAMKKIS
jgi:glycosyltransferase involved in cell wall biosynthesis